MQPAKENPNQACSVLLFLLLSSFTRLGVSPRCDLKWLLFLRLLFFLQTLNMRHITQTQVVTSFSFFSPFLSLSPQDFPLLRLDDVVDDQSNILGFSMLNNSHSFYLEFIRSLNLSWREGCSISPYPGPAVSHALNRPKPTCLGRPAVQAKLITKYLVDVQTREQLWALKSSFSLLVGMREYAIICTPTEDGRGLKQKWA